MMIPIKNYTGDPFVVVADCIIKSYYQVILFV